MYYSNGNFYQGNWEEGEKNGPGEQIYISGEKYVGEWIDGERSGLGKLFINNDVVADGLWSEDRFLSGKVKTRFYEGDWRDNAFNGNGVYRFLDGSFYRG